MLSKKEKNTVPGKTVSHLSSDQHNSKTKPSPVSDLHGTETVLVVEDEEQVRELVIEMLKTFGYRVYGASDGKKAIEIYNKHGSSINLILTDVVMPEMGGRKMIESLNNFNGHTRVIFMSGYSDAAIDEQGILVPGSEFIQKPFSPTELLKKIRQVLKK